MKVIINMDKNEFNHIKKVYSKRRGSLPYTNIAFGTPIPDNATNGDVIMIMFPDAEVVGIEGLEGFQCVAISIGLGTSYFALDWWNAPYEKEMEE